jgi:hypothetical protein
LNDAARVRDFILGALPDLKGGTLRIWGDWFGRAHDNRHRVTGATVHGESVTIGFDQGETLTVWGPAGREIDAARFRILQPTGFAGNGSPTVALERLGRDTSSTTCARAA